MFSQDNQPVDTSSLDAQLASIKPIQLTANATESIPGIAAELTLDETSATEAPDTAETVSEEEDTESTETAAEESALNNPDFVSQFKDTFGVEPQEAIEIINGLQAFRDEMSLMRTWGVSPTEYDSRISKVREFYQTLPEDKQPEFNSVQGAIAIWNHLNSGQTTTKKAAVKATGGKLKTTPKTEQIRKSDVLRMSETDYRANLPRINKAVLEGRFVEDV